MKDIINFTRNFPDWEDTINLNDTQRQAVKDHTQYYYDNILHRTLNWTEYSEVLPGLFIGGEGSVYEKRLDKENIKTVVNMALEIVDEPVDNVDMYKIGIFDSEYSPNGVWVAAAELINNAVKKGDRVLVHCAAGISRSVTAIIAYLMLYRGIGWTEAYLTIRKSRPAAYPHPALMTSLIRDVGDLFIY